MNDTASSATQATAQLRDRHRRLLGLHPDRWRAAHAGVAALLPAGLFAVHAGFFVFADEAAGVLANQIGGWLATRYGIQRMLMVGLLTQIVGSPSLLNPAWTAAMSVAWVVAAQGICGVAKDLTKTASKSAIKITADQAKHQGAGQLFKWVAWFTGSKNAMKGVGFFLGGLLLDALGFAPALWAMAGLLLVVLLGVTLFVLLLMGKARPPSRPKSCLPKTVASIYWPLPGWLCLARVTCGLWWACQCFCIRWAGPSPWWVAFWRPGPLVTAWCRRWRRNWYDAAPMV